MQESTHNPDGTPQVPQDPEVSEDIEIDIDIDEEGHNLDHRLWYLLTLLRRADAERRQANRMAGAFEGRGRVLRLLALQSPISQKELAYLLGIRSQSLAEQLSKLEDEGLVERHRDPADRRTSIVDLTDLGRESLDAEAEIPVDDPFAVLTDEEKEQFASLLDRVIDGLEAEDAEGFDPRMRAFRQMTFGGGPGD